MEFFYQLGYNGKVQFDQKPILANSGNFSYKMTPIYSTGFWGAVTSNAFQQSAFVEDYPQVQTNFGFQLTKNTSNVFQPIGDSISVCRASSYSVTMYPNGVSGYASNSWTTSVQFSASQDSLVQGTVNSKGTNVLTISTISSLTSTTGAPSNSLSKIAAKYDDVFASYGSFVSFSGLTVSSIISWNFTNSQEVLFLQLCALTTLNKKSVDYVGIGALSANGSVEALGIGSILKGTSSNNTFNYASSATITMSSVQGDKKNQIDISNLQVIAAHSDIKTNSDAITTSFQFTVLANSDTDAASIKYSNS